MTDAFRAIPTDPGAEAAIVARHLLSTGQVNETLLGVHRALLSPCDDPAASAFLGEVKAALLRSKVA